MGLFCYGCLRNWGYSGVFPRKWGTGDRGSDDPLCVGLADSVVGKWQAGSPFSSRSSFPAVRIIQFS